MGEWETRENVKARQASAQNYENAASWYGSTVKNLGPVSYTHLPNHDCRISDTTTMIILKQQSYYNSVEGLQRKQQP